MLPEKTVEAHRKTLSRTSCTFSFPCIRIAAIAGKYCHCPVEYTHGSFWFPWVLHPPWHPAFLVVTEICKSKLGIMWLALRQRGFPISPGTARKCWFCIWCKFYTCTDVNIYQHLPRCICCLAKNRTCNCQYCPQCLASSHSRTKAFDLKDRQTWSGAAQ